MPDYGKYGHSAGWVQPVVSVGLHIDLGYYQFRTTVDATIAGIFLDVGGRTIGELPATMIAAGTDWALAANAVIPDGSRYLVFSIDQSFRMDTGAGLNPVSASAPVYPAGNGITIGALS